MRKEGGVGGSPAGRSGGAGSLFGRLLLALAADDAAGETDPVWDQQVEALAALVRPDGADSIHCALRSLPSLGSMTT
jgi:hypothetical protein